MIDFPTQQLRKLKCNGIIKPQLYLDQLKEDEGLQYLVIAVVDEGEEDYYFKMFEHHCDDNRFVVMKIQKQAEFEINVGRKRQVIKSVAERFEFNRSVS